MIPLTASVFSGFSSLSLSFQGALIFLHNKRNYQLVYLSDKL